MKKVFSVLCFPGLFTLLCYRLRLHFNCLQVFTPFKVYKMYAIIIAIMPVRHKDSRKERKTHFGDVSHGVLCHVRLRAHAFPLKQRMKYKATLQSSLGKTHNCKIESGL